MVSSIIYACVLLLTLTLCFYRGTSAEKRLATVILLGNLATIAVLLFQKRVTYSTVSATYLAVDLAAVIALCWLAIIRPSWMSILVAAFQINSALGHAVKLAAPGTFDLSYAVLLRVWAWPMILTLLLAHFMTSMRRVLRQSDVQAMPKILQPHGTRAGRS